MISKLCRQFYLLISRKDLPVQKCLLVLLILFILPFRVIAAPAVTPEVLEYDFGEVAQGDKITYSFRFRNSGDELLEISSVSSSCGCTAALLSSRRIAPGDMGEIKATFDSSRFRGEVSKTITLKNNSPEHPQLQFRLKGIVKELLGVSPNRIVWTLDNAEQVVRSQVVISNQSRQQIVLQPAKSTSPQLTAKLDRLKLAPGEKATLSVSGTLPPGKERFSGYLLVATDFKPMRQLRISASGRLAK
jgi:hypothetical protein